MVPDRSRVEWAFLSAVLVSAFTFLGCYLLYLYDVVLFPFDWEPTDGDHLNFARRISSNVPIFLPLESGSALSVYTPLYHMLLALIGGVEITLSQARLLSAIFWLLVPFVVFMFYRHKWGSFLALFAALIIGMPPEQNLLIDLVHVTPTSLLAILFLVTLIQTERCIESDRLDWRNWFLLGVLAALCFLAKQQGIIASGLILACLILRLPKLSQVTSLVCGGLFVLVPVILYLEILNNGKFLTTVLFELRNIMITSNALAAKRLWDFLFVSNLLILLVVLASFANHFRSTMKLKELSIYQISLLAHIPFLFTILGNGGGGPNYFITLWLTLVLLAVDTIWIAKERQTFIFSKIFLLGIISIGLMGWSLSEPIGPDNVYQSVATIFLVLSSLAVSLFFARFKDHDGVLAHESEPRAWSNTALLMLMAIWINAVNAAIPVTRQLSELRASVEEVYPLMTEHYSRIATLAEERKPTNILTNRNIGALVAAGVPVENEGASLFSYAWYADGFDRKIVLQAIRNKEYQFISTGLQPYPDDVMKLIGENYSILSEQKVNLYMGHIGKAYIYIPNND